MPPRGYLVGYLRSYAGRGRARRRRRGAPLPGGGRLEEPEPAPGRARRAADGSPGAVASPGSAASRSSPSWWRCWSPRRWPSACGARAATRARSTGAGPPSARRTGPPALRRPRVARSAKLRAVVLRTVDYGERDRVVTLLSRERGKLSAFARGARVLPAALRRGARALHAALRRAARSAAGDLLGLESAAVERGFGSLRGDLARIACASYAVELARELVRDAEPHEELFDALVAYLGRLDDGPARPGTCAASSSTRCAPPGSSPRSTAAPAAALPGRRGAPARFDPAQGGVLCAACGSTGGAGRPRDRGRGARGAAPAAAGASRRGAPAPPTAAEARAILGAFVEYPPRQAAPVAPLPRRGRADARPVAAEPVPGSV